MPKHNKSLLERRTIMNTYKCHVSAVCLCLLYPKCSPLLLKPSSPSPWRVLDKTTTQMMTSPASLFLSTLCYNSSCSTKGGLTPAWSLASWILPGKPWTTRQVWSAPLQGRHSTPCGACLTPSSLRCFLEHFGGKPVQKTVLYTWKMICCLFHLLKNVL